MIVSRKLHCSNLNKPDTHQLNTSLEIEQGLDNTNHVLGDQAKRDNETKTRAVELQKYVSSLSTLTRT
jgi:hypothetical protein